MCEAKNSKDRIKDKPRWLTYRANERKEVNPSDQCHYFPTGL